MKRILFIIVIILFKVLATKAQWTGTSPIYNTNLSSSVGIGTSTPSQKLQIKGGSFLVGSGASPNANSGIKILAPISSTHYNWMIGAQQNVDQAFEITPSTTVGGTTFSTPAITIKAGGNVGIGTTSPISKLDVSGTLTVSGVRPISISSGGITQKGETGGWAIEYGYLGSGGTSVGGFGALGNNDALTNYYIGSYTNQRLVVTNDGNVGIGTTNPGNYKLNVTGRIRANEVVVNTSGADFVFHEDYKLPDLSDVESFIKENKHLPDIAPAAEMKVNGMNVSETQTKLLQKIEELTLYIIEQNKTNELQNREIENLKREIRILSKKRIQ